MPTSETACALRELSASDKRDAFLRAADRSQIVLVSGGLGPTRDDLTVEVLELPGRSPLIVAEVPAFNGGPADDTVLPHGTAYLTDAGMCGPDDSVLGRVCESVIWRFRSGLPTRFPIAKGPVRLCGAIVEVDTETGKALSITRYNHLMAIGEI